MRKRLSIIIVSLATTVLIPHSITGADTKLAQTGFQFLSVGSDARAAGMAEAMTTLQGYSSALYYNPAGMARITGFVDLGLNQNNWIADIKHNSLSAAFAPMGGRFGVIGFSLQTVDYGQVEGTMVWGNELGYIDTEILNPSAFSMGIGYARALSQSFTVGGQIKKAYQYLGKSITPTSDTTRIVDKNIADAFAFDFGTIYVTQWKEFTFGMSIRNFSEEIKFYSEGFQLPLTFQIGSSVDLFNFWPSRSENSKLILSLDAIHQRSYSERLNLGVEYTLMNMLALRGGYRYNYDEQGFTYGFGVHKDINLMKIGIDYAYTPFGRFVDVQQFSLNLSF